MARAGAVEGDLSRSGQRKSTVFLQQHRAARVELAKPMQVIALVVIHFHVNSPFMR